MVGVETFGGLPFLETYKQAAIRHQKAHDWPTALHWAEAGIEVYGTEALDPQVVDDLARRAANYREKLEPQATRPARLSRMTEPSSETLTCTSCSRTFEGPRTGGNRCAAQIAEPTTPSLLAELIYTLTES